MDFTGAGGASVSSPSGAASSASAPGGSADPAGNPAPPSSQPTPNSPAANSRPTPAGAPAADQGTDLGTSDSDPQEFLTDGRESDQADASGRVRFGDRDLTPVEASAEYAATVKRMQAADRNRDAMRQRAEQAVTAARAYQQILRDAGMLNEDGSMLVRSPEEIRAEALRRQQGTQAQEEPEFKFDPPDFLRVSDSEDPKEQARATDAYFEHLELVAQDKGLRYAFGLLADHMNSVLTNWHSKLTGEDGFLHRQISERTKSFEPFFQQLSDVREQGTFLSNQAEIIDDQGQLAYPELDGPNGSPEFVQRLLAAMDRVPKEYARSRQGFAQIVNSLRWEMHQESQQAGEAEAQPQDLPAPTPQPPAPAPPSVRPVRRPSNQRPVVNLDGATPSGVPRPRTGGGGRPSGGDDGSRLLENSKRGVLGGINWGI